MISIMNWLAIGGTAVLAGIIVGCLKVLLAKERDIE